jgi:hypothetical protein
MRFDEISSSELVTRYILDKSYYRTSNQSVRHNAFMPAPKTNETSVYRIEELESEEIWSIGDKFVAKLRNKELIGRADIIASDILNEELKIQPFPQPHPRHANITDWPYDPSKQKLIALMLAQKSELHLMQNDQIKK